MKSCQLSDKNYQDIKVKFTLNYQLKAKFYLLINH